MGTWTLGVTVFLEDQISKVTILTIAYYSPNRKVTACYSPDSKVTILIIALMIADYSPNTFFLIIAHYRPN